MEIRKDSRMIQARKLINAIIQKVDLPHSKIMIAEDILAIIVRDTAMYTTQLTDIQPGMHSTITFNFKDIENLAEDEYIQDKFLFHSLTGLFSYYSCQIENERNLLAYEPELRGNEDFENLLSLKSADGLKFFKVNGRNIGETYFIPIFSGFPVVNKTDKIGASVYYIDDIYYGIVLNIFKKKINRNMKIYFKTLNLQRV